ncbi:MAG: N-acetyl-gamma-glutamyl-phosphate reductase [Armatimonadetes bacterium]|nr:N-acetyl-gamma-glutamyl-phosphate reductase [Armatimonadota bacterium]
MIKVGIVGASGYAGAELIRYLLGHPGAEITYLASDTYAGKHISHAYPGFLGQDLPLCERFDAGKAADKADLFFLAQGNGNGMKTAPALIESGKKIVDVPADFRLKDLSVYKKHYGIEHSAPELAAEAVYGISELHPKEIARARIVANPGCYATSAILALAPLVSRKMIDLESLIIDSKSGVSGAGRSKIEVSGLFCEINEGFKAYAVATHRHTPEIEQELSALGGENVNLSFTPHLIPMNRGILTTAYASAPRGKSMPATSELIAIYREFYVGKTFVIVLDEGSQPCTKNVFGANFCHIGLVTDSRTGRAIITCAIDNMGKGAAGQAVQNMNLMCGLDETTGLMSPAIYP